jgi:hypothetical protein
MNELDSHVVAILAVHAGKPIGPEPGTERRARPRYVQPRPGPVQRRWPTLLIDLEEDKAARRAVVLGLLREMERKWRT